MAILSMLSDLSAGGHQALAVFTIVSYLTIAIVSVSSQSKRHHYKNLCLRAVSLLRDAARSSTRADAGGDAADVYADAVRARIYISAVDRLLTSDEVSKLTGVSLDELRAHIDHQLARARTGLANATSKTHKQIESHLSDFAPHRAARLNVGEPIAAFTRGTVQNLQR